MAGQSNHTLVGSRASKRLGSVSEAGVEGGSGSHVTEKERD